ncbi:MAG: hypothetical protein HOH43_17035 [Candidatus Latescibacteria bacterium]|nr:hypothetical protein [Candidatus Latescibacterota bacterium]
MPHVIIAGPCRVASYYDSFEPLSKTDGNSIQKTRSCFINSDRDEVLMDCIVVEGGRPQNFFVSLLQREDGILVRLLPLTDPEKTDGIRRLLVAISSQIIDSHPDNVLSHTNLQTYFDGDFS